MTMKNASVALGQGQYRKAIDIANEQIKKDPNSTGTHFTLAQAYDAIGEDELAYYHLKIVLSDMPEAFEALSLAASSAAKLGNHDEAIGFAEKALLDRRDPNLSRYEKAFFNLLSYIPGLKRLRNMNDQIVDKYTKQTQWLHEYVSWYRNQ